jgi:TolB-like protein
MAEDERVEKSSETGAQPSGTAAPVFISYASQDTATANAIYRSLESQGIACWIAPRDVRPGAQYADAIVRAINEAKAIVLVLSSSAVASAHVAREVERAASKRKPIIPFRLDEASLNPEFEYFLSNAQWIEVPKLGMAAALARLKEALGQEAVTPSPIRVSRSGGVAKRTAFVGAALVAIAIAVWVGWHFWSSSHAVKPSTVAMGDKSIAVLPFVDMSEKKDQEYFADGMAEEIIDLLVKIPDLRVISRTSSFQFKGKTEDLRTIGARLGVTYVLEGSVRKSGDRLRVTAQLIDSRNGAHLFSQTYDRDLRDVLMMQDEIATSLARALQIEVSAVAIGSRPTLRNTEAYTVYLQGLHDSDRITEPAFELTLRDFQRALDLDPTFADAATGISDAYFVAGQFGFLPPAVAFEKSREAAQLAIKLNPKLAEAHATLGHIYMIYDWDWAAAETEMKTARTLAPNSAGVLFTSSLVSARMGRSEEALKFLNASIGRDPLFPGAYEVLGIQQLQNGRLDEAEAALRRTFEFDPTFVIAHYVLGNLLLARNRPEAALAEYSKETDEGARLGGSAMAYFALGRKVDSEHALAQLRERRADREPFMVAQVYAFRGEPDEALKWLDRAFAQKDPGLDLLRDPSFNKLKDDPRYKTFLKKMKLPEG